MKEVSMMDDDPTPNRGARIGGKEAVYVAMEAADRRPIALETSEKSNAIEENVPARLNQIAAGV
jgi:hypothetical protein